MVQSKSIIFKKTKEQHNSCEKIWRSWLGFYSERQWAGSKNSTMSYYCVFEDNVLNTGRNIKFCIQMIFQQYYPALCLSTFHFALLRNLDLSDACYCFHVWIYYGPFITLLCKYTNMLPPLSLFNYKTVKRMYRGNNPVWIMDCSWSIEIGYFAC